MRSTTSSSVSRVHSKEVRVGFILAGTGATVSFLLAFIVTISAWTEPGCKNPDNDPHASIGDAYKNALPGWCDTKKAGAIFFWLAFVFWACTLGLLIQEWRSGDHRPSGGGHSGPRDPPFTHPTTGTELDDDEEGDEESSYHHVPAIRRTTEDNSNTPNSPFADSGRYAGAAGSSYANAPAGRPSMDAYGAFDDPAPSGFGGGYGNERPNERVNSLPPMIPEVDTGPKMSRTMQYADPYAAVRATIAGGAAAPSAAGAATPPSYDSYQGYR